MLTFFGSASAADMKPPSLRRLCRADSMSFAILATARTCPASCWRLNALFAETAKIETSMTTRMPVITERSVLMDENRFTTGSPQCRDGSSYKEILSHIDDKSLNGLYRLIFGANAGGRWL